MNGPPRRELLMRNANEIIVVITCLVLALPIFGCGGGREAVVAGIDPIKDVATVENNTQLLQAWVVRSESRCARSHRHIR